MSYLHARKIVHKDLKSKNIFLEQNQNRIVITDFGLLSVADIKVTNTRYSFLYWIFFFTVTANSIDSLVGVLQGRQDPYR